MGRGINLEEDFIPYYSSRAGVEYVNFAVAPGAAVAAVPAWMEEKYMFDEGSSIAAAVATACLAHALGQDNLGGKDNYTLRTQSLGYAWQREGRGLVQAELVKEAAHRYGCGVRAIIFAWKMIRICFMRRILQRTNRGLRCRK